jgi:hypothetical protein
MVANGLHLVVPQEQINDFCRRYAIRKLSLFGSVLRDDFTPESDIDVLVEFEPEARPGLFDLSRMSRELSAILGRQADLLTPGFLSPYFRQQVMEDARVIYEKVA